jgi:hypothetical protein
MLDGIGIIKGQPFEPDEYTKAILDNAVKTAFKMSKVLAFHVILAKPAARIYQDRQWTTPILGYFVILRLYGPTEAFLNQTWRPSDLEETK